MRYDRDEWEIRFDELNLVDGLLFRTSGNGQEV
jgi:hypothetical protein